MRNVVNTCKSIEIIRYIFESCSSQISLTTKRSKMSPGMLMRRKDISNRLGLSPAKHLLCFESMQNMKLFPPNTTSPFIWLFLVPNLSNCFTSESLSKFVKLLLFSIRRMLYDKSRVPLVIYLVLTLFNEVPLRMSFSIFSYMD